MCESCLAEAAEAAGLVGLAYDDEFCCVLIARHQSKSAGCSHAVIEH